MHGHPLTGTAIQARLFLPWGLVDKLAGLTARAMDVRQDILAQIAAAEGAAQGESQRENGADKSPPADPPAGQ